MVQNNINHLVSIGITTKNRWEDLKNTLQFLEVNFKDIQVLIFDDGSDIVCPFNLDIFSINIEYQRFSESKGLIVRRNQIAQAIKTKYYLSLDDDSYPVSGSLNEVVAYAEIQETNLLALAFPIFNPVLSTPQSISIQSQPYQVRSFIGCGHLLHRQNFLDLGGYREELIHQGEEMEISARGFLQDLYCFHFPGFEIHHTASNQGRNWHRMDFYGARNNLLWNDWFVPEHLKWLQQSRTIASRLALSLKVRRLGQMQGMFSAFREMNNLRSYRYSFSITKYQVWRKLPHS